jgi:site-specific DNA-methyltransferase (adenine-specific)
MENPPGVTVHVGDCLDVLRTMPDNSVDAVVTDPPAGIAFMGKDWDRDKGGRTAWVAWLTEIMTEARRVLKPGGHALVWALPRTSHWTATALEDAGLEIRDCVVHLFGSGFPKSHDIGKAIDKAAGAERDVVGPNPNRRTGRLSSATYERGNAAIEAENITAPATPDAQRWDGWGTALKPGQEIWWLVRKPLQGTVAANVLAHGVGGLNVDGCRVEGPPPKPTLQPRIVGSNNNLHKEGRLEGVMSEPHPAGRWPTNLVLTHSASCADGGECADDCPAGELDRQSGTSSSTRNVRKAAGTSASNGVTLRDGYMMHTENVGGFNDSGGASRFYPVFRYQAKAPARERPKLPDGTAWPTVKPLGLMRWLVRLITPAGGTVLDMFAGTGTTAEACALEGMACVLIERDPTAVELIQVRLDRMAS